MEQKGYVVRVHSPDDKRIRYIQITDKVEDIDKKIKNISIIQKALLPRAFRKKKEICCLNSLRK